MSDQWLSSIKLHYSKKMWNFVFNYNKNDTHHQKAYKNLHIRHLNSFLYLKLFSSYTLSKTRFRPSTQSLLRHFGPIFTFKTAITQRLFEKSKILLKSLDCGWCNHASHFYCSWVQNFPFFSAIQFNREWSLITHFLGIGQPFCLETFLVVMYLYAFQVNPKPSISHMGATKRNNFV
jgi:hypothetical protein